MSCSAVRGIERTRTPSVRVRRNDARYMAYQLTKVADEADAKNDQLFQVVTSRDTETGSEG